MPCSLCIAVPFSDKMYVNWPICPFLCVQSPLCVCHVVCYHFITCMKLAFFCERLQSSVYECMHDPFFLHLFVTVCVYEDMPLTRLLSCLTTVSMSFCLSLSFFLNWEKMLFFLLVSFILDRDRERERERETERQVTQLYSLRGDLSYTFRV